MLKQQVKLTVVGDPVAYQKKDKDNTPLKTPDGQDVVGYRRQLLFESMDYKKDSIPFTLFNDEAKDFSFSAGHVGELQFQIEIRESKSQDGESRFYPEFRLINFTPSN